MTHAREINAPVGSLAVVFALTRMWCFKLSTQVFNMSLHGSRKHKGQVSFHLKGKKFYTF